MSSLNKVMIIGRLGRDPEMRYTQAGKPICNLNVATDEGYTNDRGEKVDKTEWHKVVFWDRQKPVRSTSPRGASCSSRAGFPPASIRISKGRTATSPRFRGSASSSSTARRTATGNRADREADARHRGGTPPTMKTSAPPSLPKPPASMTF